MFAILLSSGAEWMPLQDIPIRHLQRPEVRNSGLREPHYLYRLLMPDTVETKPAFYRYINSYVDSATSVAMRNSVFPWRNANKLPRPDDHCQLWEYAVPPDLVDRSEVFLKSEDVATQWISLAHPEKLFVLLRAKPGKGGRSNAAAQGPVDLSLELVASFDEDLPKDEILPRGPRL